MAGKDIPLETQGTMQKAGRFLWPARVLIVLFMVAAMGIYVRYSLSNSCKVDEVQEASAFLVSQTKRYDDVYQVATNAFQDTVVLPVAVLQQILMDTKQVVVPVCMQTAKDELINYMGTVIRAFDAYAAHESNVTVRDLIAQSNEHYGNFFAELDAVNKCAPLCLP